MTYLAPDSRASLEDELFQARARYRQIDADREAAGRSFDDADEAERIRLADELRDLDAEAVDCLAEILSLRRRIGR